MPSLARLLLSKPGVVKAPLAKQSWTAALSRHYHNNSAIQNGVGKKASLTFEDGTRLDCGVSFGAEKSLAGEVVFNTGMVGYPESLTDPSYSGQILVMTYPIVGNYGVPDPKAVDQYGLHKFFESEKIHASGLIVQDYCHQPSHWNSAMSLSEWLKQQDVPGLYGLDTRMITKKIREHGSLLGKIEIGEETIPFIDPNSENRVAQVSTKNVQVFNKGATYKVLAVDCGIKHNIIRQLVQRDAEVTLVPWNYEISKVAHEFDGIFISNGPGNPNQVTQTAEELAKVMAMEGKDVKPMFGICMGSQLMAMAGGANTYKMKFGNRGQNQPVHDLQTGRCLITPQNHGFAVDPETLSAEWKELFVNANDGTNEGIMHKSKPYFTAQFHPEAMGGPTDTEYLFDMFAESMKTKATTLTSVLPKANVPEKPNVNKVLVLGSGGLSIGQAGEFDYSGSQAIKAFKQEGKETVLINPNIASVQTNAEGENQADSVYFLPVTPEVVESIIQKEQPDGVVLSMGGQTALNCGVELFKRGIFDKYGVKVLGTPVESVVKTEDRQLFADGLNAIGESVAPSIATTNIEGAVDAAQEIGYPVMIRSAFALGGLGSGLCENETILREMAAKALAVSEQILVEKSLKGWKEVEYEVVRDSADNCVTVCNMENFDPLGIHTGDSIVVAPSQTLSNEEYHMLRKTAIKTVRHFGIIGECNIQYALSPDSLQYYIIEINARLSRSSALASKATGYPLAFVAAKLCLGLQLPDVKNAVTQSTTSCFEPSLDYIVTKFPKWDLAKFSQVSREIGSAMKSVGEVMAIGRGFEESFQKAMRMVEPSNPSDGFGIGKCSFEGEDLIQALAKPDDKRVFAIARAFQLGYTVDQVHDLTSIDNWFLHKLENMWKFQQELSTAKVDSMDAAHLQQAKKMGFSDKQIGQLTSTDEGMVREHRKQLGVTPFVKQIDTMAAEFPAATNYLYTTYHGQEHDVDFNDHGTMVLGSGPYRIGSSVEFDWCAVSAIRTLQKLGKRSVVVNMNPETVSTDYDECDRLYFEELSLERVLDIHDVETTDGVVVSVGGQTANNLAMPLAGYGVPIHGTSAANIDNAEDRSKFSAMLDNIGIDQPQWSALSSVDEAKKFCQSVGYPCLIRPSYVLSGAAMNVAETPEQLEKFLGEAVEVSSEHPVVISKFIEGAREIEFDGVAKNGKVIAHAISEHVENAGVHSGDATLVLPCDTIPKSEQLKVKEAAMKIAEALDITGPFNCQFLSKDDELKVIECNLRASRSFPFVSKTLGVDFIEAATRASLDVPMEPKMVNKLDSIDVGHNNPGYTAVKAPMFSFGRLRGSDPVLGVEMASTGEVACFGADKNEAFLKTMLATGFKLPKENILVGCQAKLVPGFVPAAQKLEKLGYKLYGTALTAKALNDNGVACSPVAWPSSNLQEDEDTVETMLRNRSIDLVINLPNKESTQVTNNYVIRRTAVDFGVPILTNLQVVQLFADAMEATNKGSTMSVSSIADHYEEEVVGH